MNHFNRKCKSSADVSDYLKGRDEQMNAIREAQQAKREIENNITEYLMDNDLTEFFSVNWTRVQNTDW